MTEAKEDWHREQIKAAARMRGTSLTDLARASGYDATAFYKTASDRRWPAVERIIAEALGLRPQDIWPSRYDRRGVPLSARSTKRRRRPAARHRQITGAA